MPPETPELAADRREHLRGLLTFAKAAHDSYETAYLKRPDPNWATWYAGYLVDRNLAKLVGRDIPEDELAHSLTKWREEYQANGAQAPVTDYFTDRLLGASQADRPAEAARAAE